MNDALKLLQWPLVALLAVVTTGTVGYWFIGGMQHSLVDSFYMTVITITTIGFSEVIDLEGKPWGRLFTLVIALSGIGVLGYIMSSFTGFVVEGRLSKTFHKKKVQQMIDKLSGHYLVAGLGHVGMHVMQELDNTNRDYVVVDADGDVLTALEAECDHLLYVTGDATENEVLIKAGIERAVGIFATTGDDNRNLVISLTARHLNPDIRVIASCTELRNLEKIKTAGADSVISPKYIGGLRMVSEMIRPTVVNFLDVMLRDTDKNLRIEEVPLAERYEGESLGTLNLDRFDATLMLAVKSGSGWKYNPNDSFIIPPGARLIVMTTPEERKALIEAFA